MNLEQFIKSERERFEKEFLDLWFPSNVNALMPDGDSRGMRERGKDFLTASHKRLLKEIVDKIESKLDDKIPHWRLAGLEEPISEFEKIVTALKDIIDE